MVGYMGIHCKILFDFVACLKFFIMLNKKVSELHLKWSLSAQIPKEKVTFFFAINKCILKTASLRER